MMCAVIQMGEVAEAVEHNRKAKAIAQ